MGNAAKKDEPGDPYAERDKQSPFAGLPDDERARLHAALEQSEKEFAQGKGIPAEAVLRDLRER
jgi:hypothetical protein